MSELVLRFATPERVNVSYAGTDSGEVPFASPVTDRDRKDLAWYVETYGAHSLADADDSEAKRIEARLPAIGKALFKAVFSAMETYQRFLDFRNATADANQHERVLTIETQHAAVLSLPWELLHDPTGVFLFRERPRISVRRRIAGATGGRAPFALAAKERLHLLFVVSRPDGTGFIDPRADAAAVIQALEEHAPGRVTWEVLRPATLDTLTARLDDPAAPPVDILHFDGHGVFAQVSTDDTQADPARFGKSIASEIQRERLARGGADTGTPVGIGFLLFEQADGGAHLISAADLTDNLFRARVGLVVLSACQTAALDPGGDPMASVAGRLTATGIPAILAMTHAVLAVTTQHLFGQFYASLARGRGIASALDDARAWLDNHPEKFEVQRGAARRMLRLDDWFLPALFHGGTDTALLRHGGAPAPRSVVHNLRPAHEAGFFGRRRELWQIERWFVGETRRITLSGFGGVGKTELALEAARWLLLTGPWCRAVFIDYAQVQSDDALGVALSTLGACLGETLADREAAGQALAAEPTLLILDNLETVPPAGLVPLLDAAVAWSGQGLTRVLLTTRTPELGHHGYRIEGTRVHRRIVLGGLDSAAQPDDALAWFRAMRALPGADPGAEIPPPTRDELIVLFDQVAFHPLSIAVLTQQLRTRNAKQLGERLTALLHEDAVSGIACEDAPASLIASLRLSLDRLSPQQRRAVAGLGVFQGGAFEDNLLAITGLGFTAEERAHAQALLEAVDRNDPVTLLALMRAILPDGTELPDALPRDPLETFLRIPETQAQLYALRNRLAVLPNPLDSVLDTVAWPVLRRQLEFAGLIKIECIAGVATPFIRFHPTLSNVLWSWVDNAQRDALTLVHRQRYQEQARSLVNADDDDPYQTRIVARGELPNLLRAVDQALTARDPASVAFVGTVTRFLRLFGCTGEAASLACRAESLAGEVGSESWCLAQSIRGEHLLESGHAEEAKVYFESILKTLGESPSGELAVVLAWLGRCHRACGRADSAETMFRRGIAVTEALDQTRKVRRHGAALHAALGDVLELQGRLVEARAAYDTASVIFGNIGGNPVAQGAILALYGILARKGGALAEATSRLQEALAILDPLGETANVASVLHELGIALKEADDWEKAEQHYRESMRLRQQTGQFADATKTSGELALICMSQGRSSAAEAWFRKTISEHETSRNNVGLALNLSNFANFLQTQPGRLTEARQLAERSLAIKETLDPASVQIWTTYSILARIADCEHSPEAAADYRRSARESKALFAGTVHELSRVAHIIAAVVKAVGGQAVADAEELIQRHLRTGGEDAAFATVLQRILAGERNHEDLTDSLAESAPMIEFILQCLADPRTLETLPSASGDSP